MYLHFLSFEAAQTALQTINNNMGFAPGDVSTWANAMQCVGGWYFPKPEDNFISGLYDMDVRDFIAVVADII